MDEFLLPWQRVRRQLKLKLGTTQFAHWLENLNVASASPERVVLTAPSRFERDRIIQLYGDDITRLIADEAPTFGPVEITAASRPRATNAGSSALALRKEPEVAPVVLGSIPLNPLQTFETFVVGKANEVAANQARKAAESDKPLANPLFFFGATGLGKSHIIHALCQRILERDPAKRVLYVTAEWFLSKFVASVRGGDVNGFKSLVRDVDVLAIDDLHVVTDKDKTLEELLFTFDSVVDAGKQVVLSADRSPALFDGISERARSRLLNGMSIEIHPSDFELRLAILEAKAERIARENPRMVIGGEALRFIAQRINASTRDLEGALNRVVSHSHGGEVPLTLTNLQNWLADFLRLHDRRVTVEEIKAKVATFFGCKIADLESESRVRDIVRPRQVAMFLARQMTSRSLPDIARRFKKKDHTTVMHAVKQVEKRRLDDPEFALALERLRLSIRNWPSQPTAHEQRQLPATL